MKLRFGPLQVVLAGFCFAALGGIVKSLSSDLPNSAIVFFRNSIGLLMLTPWLIGYRHEGLRTSHLRYHFIRALTGLTAMYCFFLALAHIRLADAVLLSYTLPLFLPIIARIWLKESFTKQTWLAIGIGFLGVALILKPGSDVLNRYALVGLAAGVFGALAQVSIRKLTHTEPITRVVFYFALIATVISGIPAAFSSITLERHLVIQLLMLGFFATLGQIFLTRGYASAPAARVGPFIFSSVLFAGLLDWFFWNHIPDSKSFVGGLLVILGGVLSMLIRPKSQK